jgi:hypothetical protein
MWKAETDLSSFSLCCSDLESKSGALHELYQLLRLPGGQGPVLRLVLFGEKVREIQVATELRNTLQGNRPRYCEVIDVLHENSCNWETGPRL